MGVTAYLKLARVEHGVLAGLVPVASYVLAGGRDMVVALALYVSTLLAEIFLFTTNDIHNVREDSVNRPRAPLVAGSATVRGAWAMALSSLAASIASISIPTALGLSSPAALAVLALALALGYGYNVVLKRVFVVNNIVVSLVTSLTFLYGLYAVKDPRNVYDVVYLMFIISLVASLGREVVKGVLDFEGDRLFGIKTFATVLGVGAACRVAAYLTLSSCALALALAIIVSSRPWGLVLAAGLAATSTILTALSAWLLLRGPGAARRFRGASLGAMALAIASYLAYALYASLQTA